MQNKISRRQFLQVTGASAAALLLAGLPVEASAASGHLTVTPDTLVSDLRADPTFAASGVWTWQSAVDSPDTPEAGTTLSDYVGANMAQDSADALLEAIVVSPFVHGGYRVPKCLARQLEHQTDFPFIRISRI